MKFSHDIDDFLEENQLEVIPTTIDDIDKNLQNIEDLGKAYRRKHKVLQVKLQVQYEETYGKTFMKKRLHHADEN